jgi:two-component sensor histidine kinase
VEAARHSAEAQRLAALRAYDILDTPREEEFDDIVRVVSAICQTPISVINLIDEGRQWFKAEVGLGVRETPLPASICAHAILQPGLFVVPDTLHDKRFSDNPLVTGHPHLRFYAGALLETSEGLPLGTICVLDYTPRELDENQQALLRLMAKQIMKLFELRRINVVEQNARRKAELLVEENITLAREGDHRVMNSLQLVSSVLGLQSRTASTQEAKVQIEAAQRRVHAIATIHKQLHLTGSLEDIEIGSFLRRLCDSLKETAPASVTAINVKAECVMLKSALASTLGLVTAELVANAFKHAYSDQRHGTIEVEFVHRSTGWMLSVADQGPGLPPDFDIAAGQGVGMKVIVALVRRLDARLTFETSSSLTTFRISNGTV